MLVILYITSVVSSFIAPIFDDREEVKNALTSATIAIITGILYSIITIHEIAENIFDPYFWTLFGLLSLVFLDFTFLTDDSENWLNYIVVAFLGSAVLCFLCSNIHFSNYTLTCNENHDYSERISIATTVDGTENGENIYGDGFTVGLIVKEHLTTRIYEYNYQDENGEIKTRNIFENRTQITYIEADEEPYIEIFYHVDCSGYRKKSKTHVFRSTQRTYHLYIPKGSITDITPAS